MGTGYADIDNPLFFKENTMMLLGGGKDVCEKLRAHVESHYKHWLSICSILRYLRSSDINNIKEHLNIIFTVNRFD